MGMYELETSDEVRVLHTLTSWALDRDVDLVGLTVDRPSLEDVYLELTSARGRRMNTVAMSAHQLRYEQKSYWRNPASAVFTFAFPVVFLLLFGSLNTGSTIDFLGGLKWNQYYIAGILCFGVISASFTNLAMTVCIRRDEGVLKRLHGTPLPATSLFGGLLLNSIVVAAVLTAILLSDRGRVLRRDLPRALGRARRVAGGRYGGVLRTRCRRRVRHPARRCRARDRERDPASRSCSSRACSSP